MKSVQPSLVVLVLVVLAGVAVLADKAPVKGKAAAHAGGQSRHLLLPPLISHGQVHTSYGHNNPGNVYGLGHNTYGNNHYRPTGYNTYGNNYYRPSGHSGFTIGHQGGLGHGFQGGSIGFGPTGISHSFHSGLGNGYNNGIGHGFHGSVGLGGISHGFNSNIGGFQSGYSTYGY
ncbi:hypothetical protein Pmani_005833 [Petrolisthes manimaculis]|uniref:Uncharacterized protein n=1 Tax=Petrolisthes manimaculis TaxID=1843537 RepID=A0AAE1QE58_9EUCA|nr:hypothetical protein Pmani_025383 [Petrolisthes manimaculis]KAK4323472.1 hypothetical protein Pmani_005833 [Petrolisthes manimaculis]